MPGTPYGYVEGADVTNQLARGYWPSYNVPYFDSIFNNSGYPAVVAQRGPDYSYQLAPRAKIFRRDQHTVTDLNSLKYLMRQNEPNDPFLREIPGTPYAPVATLPRLHQLEAVMILR